VSRLDSFIRRLQAQRDCLGLAARLIAEVPGPVLELGLGNGRTFDHLRTLLPDREIFVFDRRVAAHPDCVPDDAHLILGDVRETLPAALARIGRPAALAHCDVGTGVRADNDALARFLAPTLAKLMAPGGIVVSDQRLELPGWTRVAPPEGIDPERYFICRVGAP
jgi:S-adenosyl-L-methionine methyltransferase